MNDLTRKILESGIIDKHVAIMMERWGSIDAGASDLVDEKTKVTKSAILDMLDAIQEESELFAQEPAQEMIIDAFDVTQASVTLISPDDMEYVAAVSFIDKFGHFYFEPSEDINMWLIPGFKIQRGGAYDPQTILEVKRLRTASSRGYMVIEATVTEPVSSL